MYNAGSYNGGGGGGYRGDSYRPGGSGYSGQHQPQYNAPRSSTYDAFPRAQANPGYTVQEYKPSGGGGGYRGGGGSGRYSGSSSRSHQSSSAARKRPREDVRSSSYRPSTAVKRAKPAYKARDRKESSPASRSHKKAAPRSRARPSGNRVRKEPNAPGLVVSNIILASGTPGTASKHAILGSGFLGLNLTAKVGKGKYEFRCILRSADKRRGRGRVEFEIEKDSIVSLSTYDLDPPKPKAPATPAAADASAPAAEEKKAEEKKADTTDAATDADATTDASTDEKKADAPAADAAPAGDAPDAMETEENADAPAPPKDAPTPPEFNPTKWSTYKVAELKTELESRSLATGGRKSDLIARLTEYEKSEHEKALQAFKEANPPAAPEAAAPEAEAEAEAETAEGETEAAADAETSEAAPAEGDAGAEAKADADGDAEMGDAEAAPAQPESPAAEEPVKVEAPSADEDTEVSDAPAPATNGDAAVEPKTEKTEDEAVLKKAVSSRSNVGYRIVVALCQGPKSITSDEDILSTEALAKTRLLIIDYRKNPKHSVQPRKIFADGLKEGGPLNHLHLSAVRIWPQEGDLREEAVIAQLLKESNDSVRLAEELKLKKKRDAEEKARKDEVLRKERIQAAEKKASTIIAPALDALRELKKVRAKCRRQLVAWEKKEGLSKDERRIRDETWDRLYPSL